MVAEPDVDLAPEVPARDLEQRPAPAPRRAVPARLRGLRAVRLRRLAYLAYGALVAAYVLARGVPEKRGVLVAFVLALLLITRIGRGRGAASRMLLDWLPFVAVLLLYDQSRRLGDKLGFPLHEHDLARADRWLFGGTDPSVWLQHHLHPGTAAHWYDAACTLVYTSHFVATPVIAAVLWLARRELWLRFVTRVVVLSAAALVTYIVFPAAPPWLASQDGYTGPVHRLSAQGWVWLHAGNLDQLLARAQDEGSNPVAAMPSVHTAIAVLVALGLASLFTSRWRWLFALYPLAMAFTLVYDGEHWVLDTAIGAGYALAAHVLVGRWERRRAARGLGPFDLVRDGVRRSPSGSTAR